MAPKTCSASPAKALQSQELLHLQQQRSQCFAAEQAQTRACSNALCTQTRLPLRHIHGKTTDQMALPRVRQSCLACRWVPGRRCRKDIPTRDLLMQETLEKGHQADAALC
jgi:hypothetical protein